MSGEGSGGVPAHIGRRACCWRTRSKSGFACLGLAFKANVDDLRESPSMEIAKELSLLNLKNLFLIEPNIDHLDEYSNTNCIFSKEIIDFKDIDIILLLVDHKEFLNIDLTNLKEKVVIDTRGIWSNL